MNESNNQNIYSKNTVPATAGMISELREEMAKGFSSLGHQMQSMQHQLKAQIDKNSAEIHGIKVLVEEQNARNVVVLDGLTSLFTRQERLEKKVDEISS